MVFCSIFRPTISTLRSSISSTSSSTAMAPLLNKFTKRTHNCGELRLPDVGKRVSLYGWVASKRSQKNNAFLVLRDAYGKVQAFVPDKLLNTVPNFHPESSICVEGTVVDRGRNRNSEMATGDIEVFAERIELLNPISEGSLPLFNHSVTEMNRLTYRYLDLRWQRMQEALRLRAKIISQMRRFLEDKYGFVDIQTPTLANFTAAGGASEYLVPFNENGECFCLPQSPQIYKQLLMCGSMDRYYQIAICYRDEKITPFRQSEFTQLDLELSFTDQESVMELVEQIVCQSWPQELEPKPIAPFPRISYSDAINKYGTDKPDIRIPWEIFDVLMNLEAPTKMFIARGAIPYLEEKNLIQWKNWIEMLPEREDYSIIKGRDFVNKFQQNNEFLQKHDIGEEDAVVICSAKNERHILKVLGRLRNYLAEAVGLRQSQNFSFIWVHKFPLFTWNEENGVLESSHHPFTAPINEHLDSLLKGKKLESIEAQHYDLVLNGVEIGGGSIRIHDAEVQRHILDKILKIDSSKLQYLITALGYGAPPHGGFALGLDRYVAILNAKGNPNASIRSVIAFPKGKFGQCFMTGSPTLPSKDVLNQYGLSRKETDNKRN